MTATMRDVAALAGVSIKTVSNVLNDYPYIRPETRERVTKAIRQLDYRVNLQAKQLKQGRTNMVGLAVPDLRVPYFAELADSVMQLAETRGVTVILEQTGRSAEHDRAVLGSQRLRMTDGLLCAPLGLDPDELASLGVDYPLVLLGDRTFGATVDHVTMANVAGAREVVAHLASRGRRRIAVLGARPGEVMGSAALRLSGYQEGLNEAGLVFDPDLVGAAHEWRYSTGVAAMEQVLDRGTPFDAVFAFSDALAIGAMHALRSRGLRIPEDVAVAGFDNIAAGEVSAPPLTTVDGGRQEIAQTALDLLLARINGDKGAPQTLTARHHLIVRDST